MATFLRLRGEKFGWAIEDDPQIGQVWIDGRRINKGGEISTFKVPIAAVISLETKEVDTATED